MAVLKCEVCEKRFNKTFNLKRHYETIHESYIPQDKTTLQEATMPVIKCEVCNKGFNKSFNLMRHYKKVHNSYIPSAQSTAASRLFKCPICNEAFINANRLNIHLFDSHDIELKSEQLLFPDESAFFYWKGSMEDQENVKYVKTRGEKRNSNDSRILVFYCNRSGYYRETVAISERQRLMKSQGSSKIGAYCPSRIRAICKDGNVAVDFCNTHVGHDLEMAHITLPYKVKKELASKIELKMPFDEILTELDCTHTDKLRRKHLLTKRDLRNIAKEFSLNNKIKMQNDRMYRRCYVRGCTTTRRNMGPDNHFFNFPKATEDDCFRYMKWAAFAQNRDVYVAGRRRQMCGKHFDIDQFTNNNRKRLLPDAVPTLYPPPEKGSGQNDHSYYLEMKTENDETLVGSLQVYNVKENIDHPVVENIDASQALSRILKLMQDVDSLTCENAFLKKENIKHRIKNEFLEGELRRWKTCAQTIASQANKNVNEEYLNHQRELEALQKQLNSATEELEAVKNVEGCIIYSAASSGKQLQDAYYDDVDNKRDGKINQKYCEVQVENQEHYDIDTSFFMVDVAREVECVTVWDETCTQSIKQEDVEEVEVYEDMGEVEVIQEEDMICEVVFDNTLLVDC